MKKNQEQPILISIVTANSQKIFQTLDTLIASIKDQPTIEIMIFDNHSSLEYQESLKKYLVHPFISIYFNQENRGFGYGHNHNLLTSEFSYAVIFNPDVLVEEETIIELVQLLQEHPECAMLAPKILNEDGTTQHLIRQKLDVFDYMLRFIPVQFVKKLFAKRLATFECRDLSETTNSYVRMISGSFMVIDVKKFQKINGFDQRYFMYFEDNDLCLTFEKAGDKLLYTPFYSIVHLYGKGAHRNFKLFRIFLHSMVKFFNKWGWTFF
ncbi:glycosyl transferase family 2 [Enterococcus villorum]|uniref:Glycosyl transferase family 2 n=1 Tax=Enterococcus villorum TaxID=112904 RepID=A0A1V8YQK3_9ENTE|nr:glycosyltransferase [Enterococcus villorum]OQO70943.1 glycosyl transferase family 2 [Enterococcus villorum]OQO74869.1 glycosyl transferase family 2 [Enterococcus villorum]